MKKTYETEDYTFSVEWDLNGEAIRVSLQANDSLDGDSAISLAHVILEELVGEA